MKADWDDPVPESVAQGWCKWFSDIKKILTFDLERRFIKDNNYEKIELHVFADASTRAYAVVRLL